MDQSFGVQISKKVKVAKFVNGFLRLQCIKRMRKDNTFRDVVQIAVIGYGGQSAQLALGGNLVGRGLIPFSEIALNPSRLETRLSKIDDGAGCVIEQAIRYPVWLEPVAAGNAPLRQAFEMARSLLARFLSQYPDCFPPTVINFSGGDWAEDPLFAAAALQSLSSSDGHVLLFNSHISNLPNDPILFPDNANELPNQSSKSLFRISSVLPPSVVKVARFSGLDLHDEARGFAFNGDLTEFCDFLPIGSGWYHPEIHENLGSPSG